MHIQRKVAGSDSAQHGITANFKLLNLFVRQRVKEQAVNFDNLHQRTFLGHNCFVIVMVIIRHHFANLQFQEILLGSLWMLNTKREIKVLRQLFKSFINEAHNSDTPKLSDSVRRASGKLLA
ncbi:hypothetical protein D3C80_1716340 [compost metagenome]